MVCLLQASSNIDHTNSLLQDLEEHKEDNDDKKGTAEAQKQEEKSNFDYQKVRQLLNFDEAPEYLKHNPFILTGYRGILNTDLCIQR